MFKQLTCEFHHNLKFPQTFDVSFVPYFGKGSTNLSQCGRKRTLRLFKDDGNIESELCYLVEDTHRASLYEPFCAISSRHRSPCLCLFCFSNGAPPTRIEPAPLGTPSNRPMISELCALRIPSLSANLLSFYRLHLLLVPVSAPN